MAESVSTYNISQESPFISAAEIYRRNDKACALRARKEHDRVLYLGMISRVRQSAGTRKTTKSATPSLKRTRKRQTSANYLPTSEMNYTSFGQLKRQIEDLLFILSFFLLIRKKMFAKLNIAIRCHRKKSTETFPDVGFKHSLCSRKVSRILRAKYICSYNRLYFRTSAHPCQQNINCL